jgi:hypothetical protein
MPRRFGTQNFPPWTAAAAPAGLNVGDTYYNTTDRLLYVWDIDATGSTYAWRAMPRGVLNGWYVSPFGAQLNYASTTSLTVVGSDVRSITPAGTPIYWYQVAFGYSYGYVTSSTYASSNTTLNVIAYSGAIQTNTIPEWGVALGGAPPDFPASFPWTPTFTGFASQPSSIADQFFVVNGWCCYAARTLTGGTSNATTFTFNLPFTAKTVTSGQWQAAISCDDNSAVVTVGGSMRATTASATCVVQKDWDNANPNKWTTTGTKRVTAGTLWYPIR